MLDDVGGPAENSADDEQRRVEFDIQAHVVVQAGAGPVEVGGQALLGNDDALDGVGARFQ